MDCLIPPEHIQATIVIPLRVQHDPWLEQSVLSALRQSVPTTVLVVRSEATPLSNLSVLDRLSVSHPRLCVLCRPPGAGFADAINLGFKEAETERVGLLFSDDWLSPNAVEQCLPHQADIVSTGIHAYGEDGQQVLWKRIPEPRHYEQLSDHEARADYMSHFFLFRRSVVLAVGGVDSSIGLTGADDYDLIWTLLEWGASVNLLPTAMYHCRDHGGERLTLRAQDDQIRDLRKILSKHGVGQAETERLVAEKRKWYGAPCHVVIADPHWDQPGRAMDPMDSGT
jgi:GT2 family glycosyltransferase